MPQSARVAPDDKCSLWIQEQLQIRVWPLVTKESSQNKKSTRQQNPSKQAPDGSKWKSGFSSKSAKTLVKTESKSWFRRKHHNEIIRLRSFSTGQLAMGSHMRSISSKTLFQVIFVVCFFKNELKRVQDRQLGLRIGQNGAFHLN